MQTEDPQQYQQPESYSVAGEGRRNVIDPTFLQLRLDTERIIDKIESFLSAKRSKLRKDKNGEYIEEEVEYGKALANKKGITGILNMIHMRINHHTVQGNFKEDHYLDFIKRQREELTEACVINCYDWGIEDNKIALIVDTIMGFIEPFISRVINNKERDSYMQTFESKEVVDQRNKKGLNIFRR